MPEQTIAVIRPSQLINLPHYLIWTALAIVLWRIDDALTTFEYEDVLYTAPFWIVPLFIICWKWLVVRRTTYEITDERLRFRRGVLNIKVDESELYRVRDFSIRKPFILMIFGLGILRVDTQDIRHPTFELKGIADSEKVLSTLRAEVERVRQLKGVRDVDLGNLNIS